MQTPTGWVTLEAMAVDSAKNACREEEGEEEEYYCRLHDMDIGYRD